MRVTIYQLAKAAGVSAATVSRALSNSSHTVNPETRQRITDLAREMGYEPNQIARSLRMDRTYIIGLIVDNIASPFSPVIVRGIHDCLKEHGYSSILFNADFDPSEEARAVKEIIKRSVDGAIFVEPILLGSQPDLDLQNMPYVYVHRLLGYSSQNTVAADDRYGAQLAVEHLVKLGHKRIAFINGLSNWDPSIHRMEGYQDILEKYELPFDSDLIVEGDWEVQDGYQGAKKLLALPQSPTAIFASNDLLALGATFAIQEAGLRVPEDIAIVGFDNWEIATLSVPRITTVMLPCYEMGVVSAQMILDLLDGHKKTAEPVVVRGELIIRESCGAVSKKLSFENYSTQLNERAYVRRRLHRE